MISLQHARRELRWILGTVGLLAPVAAWSADWHVNPTGSGDAPTIQAAYDAASPGDRIVLAPGVYRGANTRAILAYDPLPNTATAVAHMSAGVSITGVGGAFVTRIDGEGSHRGLIGADLGSCEISGITFINCRTAGDGGGTEKWGGGVLTYRSGVVIERNRFIDCVATGGGGGGGVLIQGSPEAAVRWNVFARNRAGDLGGALEIFETASASVMYNAFLLNHAADRGGAVMINNCSVELSNNVFVFNSAGADGGALACLNSFTVSGGCNLFWRNSPAEVLACSVVIGAAGNIAADPQFCDVPGDQFLLRAGSPAIGAEPAGCGPRGAFEIGCEALPITTESWGAVKSTYR